MLTRRDLLCRGGAAGLFALCMKGSSALAQASTERPSDAKTNVEDPKSFSHHFATTNGIRMHYVEEGQGPLVLLLHGYPFLWYLWRHQIKVLAAAGYRVVAPDQRGYGQTDGPQDVDAYDMTRLVGDVVGLMNTLDSTSAVLVGQDWGSPVAYHVALMRPDLVRGVLMMCAPPTARGAIRPSDAMKQIYGSPGEQ